MRRIVSSAGVLVLFGVLAASVWAATINGTARNDNLLQGLSLRSSAVFYKGWRITATGAPIPVRDLDYVGVHDDYDGAPDSARTLRNTVFTGPTPDDVLRQILEADRLASVEGD